MPVDWSVIIPLFLLICLILLFLVYVWYTKKTPKEGFQVSTSTNLNAASLTNSTYQTIYGNINAGQGSSVIWGSSIGSQSQRGNISKINWPKTDVDNAYDDYWLSEILAQSDYLKTLPTIPIPPLFAGAGASIADFDPLNPVIPWDQDNSSGNPDPSTCTWGRIHPEASKSIFLKNYVMNLIEAPNPPGCDPHAVPYCYASPLLQVQTTNPGWGRFIEYGIDGFAANASQNIFMSDQLFSTVAKYTIKPAYNTLNSAVTFVTRSLGWSHAISIGEKKIQRQILKETQKQQRMAANIAKARAEMGIFQKISYEMFSLPAAMCSDALGVASKAAGPVPLVSVVLTAVSFVACVSLYATFVAVVSFVSSMMIILMLVQTVLPVIMQTGYKTGGVCPEGFEEFHHFVPLAAQDILGIFVPGLGVLRPVFETYLCFSTDKNKPQIVLKQPPHIPPFMFDRTYSLTYHAAWMTTPSPQTPEASVYSTLLDPPPPGFVMFANSDLANNPDQKAIVGMASGSAPWGRSGGSDGSDGSSKFNPLSQLLYVQVCPEGTTPSVDGSVCNQMAYPITPIQPTLTACAAGQIDDGTNCLIRDKPAGCTGGVLTYSSSPVWDPFYGYSKITHTPYLCNGQITDISGTPYLKRMMCPPGYETNGKDEYMCYPKCTQPAGYTPVSGVTPPSGTFYYTRKGAMCLGSIPTQKRQVKFATSTNISQTQPFKPSLTIDDITFPYCDFSSPTMLDRMAQFYYNNSFQNPGSYLDSSGNTIMSVQYITKFFSVIASSELSCDVICEITFASFDLVTGEGYTSSKGCMSSYENDKTGWKNCPFCFRRFYFIHDPEDPQGVFTVTACTMTDYTAPSAMVHSTDYYINIPAGLHPPDSNNMTKTWIVNERQASTYDPASFAKNSMQLSFNLIFGVGGFVALLVGQAKVVDLAGKAGFGTMTAASLGLIFMGLFSAAQSFAEAALNDLSGYAIPPNQVKNQNGQFVMGMNGVYNNMYNSDWWTVDQGLIYELSQGYQPNIQWCQVAYVSSQFCSYKYVVRDMVDYYHLVSPGKHIKEITAIEPRGTLPSSQGCYYKWKEVDYDPVTNLEADVMLDKEVIIPTIIRDHASCAFKLVKNNTNSFNTNIEDPSYAVRSFVSPIDKSVLFPTRKSIYTSDLVARFIRIRPSLLAGDGLLNLTQIKVYDTNDKVISFKRRTTASTTAALGQTADTIVNGNIHVGKEIEHVWQSGTPNRNTEYWEVDLGDTFAISRVTYYGSSIGVPLTGSEGWPTNAAALVQAVAAADAVVVRTAAATAAAAAAATVANSIHAWTNNFRESINNAISTPYNAVGLNSFSRTGAPPPPPPPPPSPSVLQLEAAKAASENDLAVNAATAAKAAATIYRNYGVRIQFLYSNTVNEVPVYEYVLPTDDPIQFVNVYNSKTMRPIYPIAGSIKIPRPLGAAKFLGAPDCPYKCEDKPMIDNLVQQYNTMNPRKQIIGVLSGTTASTGTPITSRSGSSVTPPPSCEYQVELITTDDSWGWKGSRKGSQKESQTISREYINMTLESNILRPPTNVFGRFVVVTPSMTPGTVLEISKLLVYTINRTNCGSTSTPRCIQYTNNARGQAVSFFNGIVSLSYNPIGAQSVVDGTITPQKYTNANLAPSFFIAADNDPSTFFQIDLGQNMEIYQIVFVGRSDEDRIRGGIQGIQISIYVDQPSDQINATDGTYPPVFFKNLPTDACMQTINVLPLPQCNFTLVSATQLVKPQFIQEDTPAFSSPDTSGGVFTFDSIIKSMKTVWNSILPLNATDPLVPATENIKESNKLLGEVRDTIAEFETILDTTHKCSDTAILKDMMTAYNILHSPSPTKQFSFMKKKMIKILKAGPSTPNSCDLLFEEKYDIYSDYIIDTTGDKTGTDINATRFVFTKSGNTVSISPDSTHVYDISSNALGIISDATIVTPIFKGPDHSIVCTDPAIRATVVASVIRADTTGSTYTKITQTFQSSPLSCEYRMEKDYGGMRDRDTFVRAIFTLPNILTSTTEYFIPFISSRRNPVTNAYSFYFNSAPNVPITLPSLFSYDTTKPSSRVNNEIFTI